MEKYFGGLRVEQHSNPVYDDGIANLVDDKQTLLHRWAGRSRTIIWRLFLTGGWTIALASR
jgi:hypothetical protein